VYSAFTASHRGGSGSPLVCLHGFMETWRVWELVLPALERRHDVLAPTLPGHAGGPPLEGDPSGDTVADAVERAMDDAGFDTAHLVGSSMGGFAALQLAARGRARSVVAFAPAGGWAPGDDSWRELLAAQARLHEEARAIAPHAAEIAATPEGRRRAMQLVVSDGGHLPPDLVAHEMLAIARAPGAQAMIDHALREGYGELDAEAIACPVRVVWGTEDRLLPWPSAAARFREQWLPHADWVELEGVGHCPHLDVPLEAAQLVLGVTAA
jgi:pimeloyl-ACP methyl ester carboxylesterase